MNNLPYNSPSTPFLLPSGTDYTLTVTDADGCTSSATVPWPSIPVVSIDLLTTTPVLCFNGNTGTASVITSGGTAPLTTNWNTVNPSSIYAGTYDVVVTDINGCTSGIVPYTVTEPTAPLLISGTIETLASCAPGTDGTSTITASGGTGLYTYLWSDGTIVNPAIKITAGPQALNQSTACR